MLLGQPTKYGSGITIYGDHFDLQRLYETLHALAGKEGVAGEGILLGFAYEIRKAYSGLREQKKFKERDAAMKYFGVNYFWTDVLIAVNVMRQRLDQHYDDLHSRADTFRLEAITHECLRSFDEGEGKKVSNWFSKNRIPVTPYLERFSEHATYELIKAKPGLARFRKLLPTLKALLPFSSHYSSIVKYLDQEAKRHGCDVSDLSLEFDFDEESFKW